MQIKKINTNSGNYKTVNKQKNNQPSFGIYIDIKPEAYNTFITKKFAYLSAKVVENRDAAKIKEAIGNFKGSSKEFVQNGLRNILEHNNKPENHYVYNDVVKIEDIDLQINGTSIFEDPKNVLKTFTIDSPPTIVFKSVNDVPYKFNILSNGKNMAAAIQETIISKKSLTEQAINTDISLLIERNHEIITTKEKTPSVNSVLQNVQKYLNYTNLGMNRNRS